jgi:transporter family-2 protein
MATRMTRQGRLPVIPASVTVALGSLIAVQSRVNGELALHGDTGLYPAWWTMITGLALLAVIVTVHRPTRRGLGDVRAAIREGSLPLATLTGGVFGGLFLITQAITVPLVGVAVFAVGVVAGQTSGSLLVDRLGISASGVRHITWNRVVASIMAVLAVGIAISDRLQSTSGAIGYAVLAFLAGFVIGPQQAANGRVAVQGHSPFAAAFVNFLGGVVMLTVFLLAAMLVVQTRIPDPWGAPWWAYLGGVLGLAVIAGAAWVVPVLGVLVFSLLSVLGQLTGAFLLDLLAPTPGTSVGWHLLIGLAMTFAAVVVASRNRR